MGTSPVTKGPGERWSAAMQQELWKEGMSLEKGCFGGGDKHVKRERKAAGKNRAWSERGLRTGDARRKRMGCQ